jgi:AcrR family transcriptional regulator
MSPNQPQSKKKRPAGARPPGRPRSPEVEEAVVHATVELLQEVSYGRLSIEMVAERAGVGKPAVYRRWPSKATLVADVIARIIEPVEINSAKDIKKEVRRHLLGTYRRAVSSGIMHVIPSIVGETVLDTELGASFRERFVEPRQRIIEDALTQGVAEGILRHDISVSLMHKMLASTEFYSWIMFGQPLTEREASAVFEEIWTTISRR